MTETFIKIAEPPKPPAPVKKVKRPKTIYQLPDGTPLTFKSKIYGKFFKDMIRFQNEVTKTEKSEIITIDNPDIPVDGTALRPDRASPICIACGLDQDGCQNPYLEYAGTTTPLVTIIVESVSKKEDSFGSIGAAGQNAYISGVIFKLMKEHGVQLNQIRWVPLTRCASFGEKIPNYRTKGNWCRHYVIQDLIKYPPKVVVPVGTAALGLLSHKSNAGDWSGRLLTWRGWPDDWLMDSDYCLDRVDPQDPLKLVRGHPLYGPAPNTRIPLVPLQNPRLILAAQNSIVTERWKDDLVDALLVGKHGVNPLSYDRPWYRILTDHRQIIDALQQAIDLAIAHPGMIMAYDTETTGLKQWAFMQRIMAATPAKSQHINAAALTETEEEEDMVVQSADPSIVFMMFRWKNPVTGQPESLGFPWDYATSEVEPYIEEISPYVITLLTLTHVTGHNLTFDELFTIATVGRKKDENIPFLSDGTWNPAWLDLQERINLLCEAAKYDTWHMVFTLLQKKGSLGLELLTYDWVPDLAGYEEEMTLLIGLHGDLMDPANNKGGHYANCPKELWGTHLRPYVMGDAEATFQIREKVAEKLEQTKVYQIPLADPEHAGRFRRYQCPSRAWVYHNVVSPASSTLTKMMARGMYISPEELSKQEKEYPQKVQAAKDNLRKADPDIERWCVTQEQEAEQKMRDNPDDKKLSTWELDLESKAQLKALLFDTLKCKITRLTKSGRAIYGQEPEGWSRLSYEEQKELAAVDKYTLNRLAVDHPNLRPLQEYRKVFKLYSTYVRPMRNMMAANLDKSKRKEPPHLCYDQCIHTQFMLTGTRSGRLSSKSPNLQQLPNEGLVKRLFTSRFKDRGCVYAADLSQIELRLMACACGDPSMVKAYLDDIDIHSLTASKIVWQGGKKIPYEHFTKKYMEWLQQHKRSDEAKDLELKRKIAKCVDPSSLISLSGRITRIGSIHGGRTPDTFYDLKTFSHVQGPEHVVNIKRFYSNGPDKRLLVVSRKGLVACSRSHRFMLQDGTLTRADQLKKGMTLARVQSLKCGHDSNISIPFDPFGTQSRCSNFTINVDCDLAYVLGLFYGDGYSSSNYVAIITGGSEKYFTWQDTVAKILTNVGFKPTIDRTTWLDEKTGASYGKVIFGSVRVSDMLMQLGAVTKERKRSFTIPEWLLNASHELKTAFLAGLIDTDGTVSEDGGISITTKSWNLAQDVIVMLRSLDIAHSVEPSWNKTYKKHYFRVRVAIRHAWQFFGGKLKRQDKKMRLRQPAFKYTEERPNDVLKIIELENGELVDIEVDSPTHLYLVNGLTSHNTTNFLTGYGGGAFGLQNVLANAEVYMTLEECEEIVYGFFEAYPTLKQFLGVYKNFIEENGRAVSLFGRVRHFEEVFSEDREASSKALRAGCNHLIQSTASDMMLICLFSIEKLMRDAKLNSLLVSTVHDSLVIDAVREELPEVHAIVNGVMNNIPLVIQSMFPEYDTSWLTVPLAGDSEVGINYLESNKISGENPDWDKLLSPKENKKK